MFLILLIVALTSSAYIQALPAIDQLTGETTLKDATGEYEGWYVPQSDGGFEWVSRDEVVHKAALFETTHEDIVYLLYTRENPTIPQEIPYNDVLALKASNFNSSRPTRAVIHGWMNDHTSPVNTEIIPSVIASEDSNVICVDWGKISKNPIYSTPRYEVPSVGVLVAEYFDFLYIAGGMQFSDLCCIGHSLGAHVCGLAGKNVAFGRIAIIYGLDPALPLFRFTETTARLSKGDANYVETFHTNGGQLGFLDPIGDCSFYPNGGKSQPGCTFDITGKCSHLRAHTYFAEKCIHNNFLTYNCSSADNAVKNNCDSTYSSTRMGSASNYGTSGYYYVPVKSSPLYGYGV